MNIRQATRKLGKDVRLFGWVHRKRESGGIIFIVLRDVTGIMQVSVKKANVDERSWKMASDTTVESSIEAGGIVKEDKRSPTGHELEAKSFRNVHISEYSLKLLKRANGATKYKNK